MTTSSYISSFLIEPVVRQARRFSRPSTYGDDSWPNNAPSPPLDDLGILPEHGAILDDHEAAAIRVLEMSHHGGVGTRTSTDPRFPDGQMDPPSRTHLQDGLQPIDAGPGASSLEAQGTSEVPISSGTSAPHTTTRNDATMAAETPGSRSRRSTGPRMSRSSSDSQSQMLRNTSLPADDGQRALRKRIIEIREKDLPPSVKARLMHTLMTEAYASTQGGAHLSLLGRSQSPSSMASQDRPFTPSSFNSGSAFGVGPSSPRSPPFPGTLDNPYSLSPDDLTPTYAPKAASEDEKMEEPLDLEQPIEADGTSTHFVEPGTEPSPMRLGCQHYLRNVKLQCAACNRWYTCRFCHDEVEDHSLNRRETKNMLCMLCGTPQPAAESCAKCERRTAHYYCDICKLWDDDSEKSIYHCNDCGICRIGQGLGKDFYHCKIQIISEPSTEQPPPSRPPRVRNGSSLSPTISRHPSRGRAARAPVSTPYFPRSSSHHLRRPILFSSTSADAASTHLPFRLPRRTGRSASPVPRIIDNPAAEGTTRTRDFDANSESGESEVAFWGGDGLRDWYMGDSDDDDDDEDDEDYEEDEASGDGMIINPERIDSDEELEDDSEDEDSDEDDEMELIGHR
ncbi:MAG: hypothetical protein M4579_005148 [Chaenotheca gracillima]|nr:MAG: hypothetical protein M4579_005148 [Chaenotheca gracillima]